MSRKSQQSATAMERQRPSGSAVGSKRWQRAGPEREHKVPTINDSYGTAAEERERGQFQAAAESGTGAAGFFPLCREERQDAIVTEQQWWSGEAVGAGWVYLFV